MTLVEVCRDTLRVLCAEHVAALDELRQMPDGVELSSEQIKELWHDG